MKPSEIKVGATYRNARKGQTTRKVLQITKTIKAPFYGALQPKHPECVRFETRQGTIHGLTLSSFARWAGSEVK